MTSHELARKLLKGPDLPVAKPGHEPNEDSFDEVERIVVDTAWRSTCAVSGGDLMGRPFESPYLSCEPVSLVVLR